MAAAPAAKSQAIARPGKHPILAGWPERATTNPALIRRWWHRSPRANVGLATGPDSGILVLDVDGPEGERSLVALERRHGPLPDLFPMSWTGGGRGGLQAFLAYPAGRQIGNSGGRLGAKLDTRGERGNAILPPSVTAESYRWAPDRSPFDIPPEPAPGWLVELLDPPAAPEPDRPAWQPDQRPAVSDRYLERAIASELALVAYAPSGTRNDTLNDAAFRLFRFAADGRLHASALASELRLAAHHAGLTDREIASTLKSAARKRGVPLR